MALKHHLVSLSENLFKSAILTIEELKKQEPGYIENSEVPRYDNRVINVLNQIRGMLGFLVILPEDPENDCLHLFSGLNKMVQMLYK